MDDVKCLHVHLADYLVRGGSRHSNSPDTSYPDISNSSRNTVDPTVSPTADPSNNTDTPITPISPITSGNLIGASVMRTLEHFMSIDGRGCDGRCMSIYKCIYEYTIVYVCVCCDVV